MQDDLALTKGSVARACLENTGWEIGLNIYGQGGKVTVYSRRDANDSCGPTRLALTVSDHTPVLAATDSSPPDT